MSTISTLEMANNQLRNQLRNAKNEQLDRRTPSEKRAIEKDIDFAVRKVRNKQNLKPSEGVVVKMKIDLK